MADRKITDLTALAAGSQATGDLLTIVDVSEGAAADKNKKITVENLLKGIPSNVGIGTSSPTGYIHIQGASTGTETYGRFTTGSANGDQSLVIKSGSSRDHMAIQVSTNAGANDDLSLQPDGGNVGIGTTSASAPLAFGKSDYGEPSSENFYRIKFKDNGGVENDVGIGMPNANSLAFNSVSNGSIRFYTGTDGESMRVDDSGRLLVGTSTARANFVVGLGSNTIPAAGAATASALFSNATGAGDYGLIAGATSSGHGYLQAQRADGIATTYDLFIQPNGGNVGIGTTSPLSQLHVEKATQAHITVKTASSNMAKFGSKGNDVYIAGTAGAANIIFKRNVTSTDHPADSGSETVRILSGGGITFNGDTAAANALDDYEEGEWTPTAVSFSGTLTVNSADYVKVGQLVHINLYISFSNTSDSSNIIIDGLPFTVAGQNNHYSLITTHSSGNMPDLALRAQGTTTRMQAVFLNNGDGDDKPDYNNAKGKFIIAGGTYRANN